MGNKDEFKPIEIEKKWQNKWESDRLFTPNLDEEKKPRSERKMQQESGEPFYNLMMFPYPSAEGLHVGNMYAFTGADVYARFNRMQGRSVFEPIGLDGFGIHSENYALKIGRHPKEQAKISQENFYRQLRSIGNSFDWTRTLETYDPVYYRWTQWLFIKLFKAGLAYRKKAEVNWCPSCKTVLSDEQVIDGKCERCGTVVERKHLEQWFFRITKYAERLLNNIEKLDWSEKVKVAQKNWIGKKTGINIKYKVKDSDELIEVFTTRPDTLFGATFLVVSPEHPFVVSLLNSKFETQNAKLEEMKKYINTARNKSEEDRTADDKEKTGVFSGLYAVNPVTQKKIPIWIADYVLTEYGMGAIMAVPAHDQRDFEFAKKYNLPIKEVILGNSSDINKEAYIGEGKLINSGDWDGWEMPKMMHKVIDWLGKKGLGHSQSNYHLRDWLISRQRYWGPPIPMVFCSSCFETGKGERDDMPGWYTVPFEDLPVLLPDVEDWKPMGTGLSPLDNHPEFYKVKCPECGRDAKRETDVSDTFLDSAWYFLGYISDPVITGSDRNAENISRGIKVDQENFTPWDKNIEKKWLPVKKYIGGAEHSVLHLLYSRFISMVLYDLKLTDFEEPFSSFFAHGLIIKDGAKMSKSKGNVVIPDEYIAKYGVDTLRTYLMFLGPFSDGGDFRDSGIEGMNRFVRRVWTLFTTKVGNAEISNEGRSIMHRTIKKVTEDIAVFKYNTAIAALMEWYNFLSEHEMIHKDEVEIFLKLLAPFAPFMTEELWLKLGYKTSIHISPWPIADENYITTLKVTIVVQVNGRKRAEFVLSSEEANSKEKVEIQARELVKKYTEGKEIKKIIFVPKKIINFAV